MAAAGIAPACQCGRECGKVGGIGGGRGAGGAFFGALPAASSGSVELARIGAATDWPGFIGGTDCDRKGTAEPMPMPAVLRLIDATSPSIDVCAARAPIGGSFVPILAWPVNQSGPLARILSRHPLRSGELLVPGRRFGLRMAYPQSELPVA
jgi:hypothetical protein